LLRAMKLPHLYSAFLACVLLSGCLTSPNAFYTEADIIQDDRILGDYREQNAEDGTLIQRITDQKGRYRVRSFEGEQGKYWISFVGTLFKVGDKTFLDLYPTSDSSFNHVGGTPPGGIEILHRLVYQPLHLVARVDFSDAGVAFSVPQQAQLATLVQRDPALRQFVRGESLQLQLKTPELRKLLEKHGASDDIFPKSQKFQKPRTSKETGLPE
jgi:hypothetical protein